MLITLIIVFTVLLKKTQAACLFHTFRWQIYEIISILPNKNNKKTNNGSRISIYKTANQVLLLSQWLSFYFGVMGSSPKRITQVSDKIGIWRDAYFRKG